MKQKPTWVIEYFSNVGGWTEWNEMTPFCQRTFLCVFYSKDAANMCLQTIRLTPYWKKKRFRLRKVSVI